ncbi:glycosyl hydrolase 108 family protein [uncultured Desulfovibrio sp.]|uniref:glycoside hydrolase family 108 protein n=1 Tax=uncultured Desulfovibrio sp. TaxID=167968 RepID=UPI0028055F07|nr:glycosyl hydrolase 108 family protein [uncultured Desulfovibrio sp.]
MRQGDFSDAHQFTARWEGGLSDHPADRGGLTAYGASLVFVQGIAGTQAGRDFLQQIGIDLPVTRQRMRRITFEQARAMFRHEFWDALHLDDLPFRQAALLYDAAVNSGPAQAVRLSQRGYNQCVTHGVKLAVDGVLGPMTRKALQTDTDAVIRAIIQARRDFYESLAESRPDQRVFLKGWLNRADALEKLLLA